MHEQLARVDYRSFCDAVETAIAQGGRIRASDPAFYDFLVEHDFDPSLLTRIEMHRPGCAVMALSEGLARGIYIYWPGTNDAFFFHPRAHEAKPLQRFSDEMEFAVCLSYAFDRDGSRPVLDVEALADDLRSRGLSVYIIRASDEPDDPLWRIRYREAMFYSHYLVPVLDRGYLDREGTQSEMTEIERMTLRHRSTTFFYPTIPLIPDPEVIRRLSYDREGLGNFDWIRTHMFSIGGTWPRAKIVDFISSLVKNVDESPTKLDLRFLRTIEEHIVAIDLVDLDDRRVAVVYLNNPILPAGVQIMISDSSCRFMGTFEPSPGAIDVRRFVAPVDALQAFLSGADIEDLTQPSASYFDSRTTGRTNRVPALSCARPPRAVDLRPDGRRLAVGFQGETDLLDLDQRRELKHWDRPVDVLAWGPDGSMLTSEDHVLTLRSEDLEVIVTAECWAYAASWSADGTRIAVSTFDGVRLFDASLTGVPGFHIKTSRRIPPAIPSPTGDQIVVLESNVVEVWDATGTKIATPLREACSAARFSPDGELLCVGTDVGRIVVVDPRAWRVITRHDVIPSRIMDIRFRDSETMFVGCLGKAKMLTLAVVGVTTGRRNRAAPDFLHLSPWSVAGPAGLLGVWEDGRIVIRELEVR